ncbi:MAG: carbon storage regulator [Gammaproteobacteria bacterium]|nr:carbon storage regulator [Gammaproteobacteria bacterium]
MDILSLPFETPLILTIKGETVKIVTFKTLEHGNIKFGIDAARSVKVNREEIHLAMLKQEPEEE